MTVIFIAGESGSGKSAIGDTLVSYLHQIFDPLYISVGQVEVGDIVKRWAGWQFDTAIGSFDLYSLLWHAIERFEVAVCIGPREPFLIKPSTASTRSVSVSIAASPQIREARCCLRDKGRISLEEAKTRFKLSEDRSVELQLDKLMLNCDIHISNNTGRTIDELAKLLLHSIFDILIEKE